MEYPTLITADTYWFMPKGALVPEIVTQHEFGHQYWYGMVATNEFEEAWLDEGINSYMETNVPGIFAAGNCAETFCAIRRRPVLNYIGTVAAKQGRVAGENMAARRTKFFGAIGTTVLKVFDLAVARTGLCLEDAAVEGMPVVTARIEAMDRAAYYPTARKIWVKLLAERENRKLVGAQVAGYGDASKRVDVAAAAITAGLRVDELAQLDLAYSPPYGNLWDPLLIAAQAVLRKMTL